MLILSDDPEVAERQMAGTLFYLTTFGYIDGDFDDAERAFIRDYIDQLVRHRIADAMPDAAAVVRDELTAKEVTHYGEVFEAIDAEVQELWSEAVAEGDSQEDYVRTRLKLRCFEIFGGFDDAGQEALLATVDELLWADGVAHPEEVKFREELSDLLHTEVEVEIVEIDEAEVEATVAVAAPTRLEHEARNHPFFDRLEHHYSRDPELISRQMAADRQLMARFEQLLTEERVVGDGRLAGHKDVGDFAGGKPFLDGHVYVHPVEPGQRLEVHVVGDLHGCYSCLKATVMQTDFFEKVRAYKANPVVTPKPLLVLLGDYIDRGIFSYNGVLRAVMQIYCAAPEHVFVLRGNHEYYLEYQGDVYGGVKPAEAINTLKPHLPTDVFRDYLAFFESLPNMLLLDRVLFVHAGIPRDSLITSRYRDLSSLNDPDIRFQMMWSDPSRADIVPPKLQEQSSRFAFGQLQFQAFMRRLGAHTLIRGHEKVDAGFETVYDDGHFRLLTLFSAGGFDNEDLPLFSSYRSVTPMALTLEVDAEHTALRPWEIDYAAYNDPERNAFYRTPNPFKLKT